MIHVHCSICSLLLLLADLAQSDKISMMTNKSPLSPIPTGSLWDEVYVYMDYMDYMAHGLMGFTGYMDSVCLVLSWPILGR